MALCLAALAASEAEARVIRIEIKRTEPAFVEGKTFGKTGAYEKLVGRAYGEVEPRGTQSSSTSTRRRKTSDVEGAIATYTGWALRAEPAGANDGCDGSCQMIPFAKTKAERTANDDPRPSRQERYPTHDAYVNAVRTASQDPKAALDDDVKAYVQRAESSQVGRQKSQTAQYLGFLSLFRERKPEKARRFLHRRWNQRDVGALGLLEGGN